MHAAESLAEWLARARPGDLPAEAVDAAGKLFIDCTGLCLAARREPYVLATLAASDRGGPCTALGHQETCDAFGAALVNGTAAHGEDYDDTFEGGPVHSGAVIAPAVLAACEREQLGGERLLIGIATGAELLCRLSLVAPQATHRAGFHPTAVFGALAAAGAVSAALELPAETITSALGIATGAELLCRLSLVAPQATHRAGFHPTAVFGALAAAGAVSAALELPAETITSALGIAGSMASGIIEYLAEGTWTKRMHAGWAAQSGIRAALMARGGFLGPRTVLDGTHGFYRAFAPSATPDFKPLVEDLGTCWVMPTIAFKPYACGTMTQPFIDCAIQLAHQGIHADEIADIVCDVAEGTVHRLWEPLALKHTPPTPYAAKFSTPFCMAVGFFDRKAGFAQFTDAKIHDPAALALASKIRYRINPADEYPRTFTGHLRATTTDGRTLEFRQPHMRGGAHAPLTGEEFDAKFMDNVVYGGWSRASAEYLLNVSRQIFTQPRLDGLKELRA